MTRNFKLWKPRAGDLRNAGLQLSRRQPRRTRRSFADNNFSVSLSFISEKPVLGAMERLNPKTTATFEAASW
ncbi:MAG: hypothetical protein ACI9HK_006025 [Pirellulaceae bacterium]|jgi:hypothetical protein